MSAPASTGSRLRALILPTSGQIISSILAALLLAGLNSSAQLFKILGIGDTAVSAAQSQFHQHFDSLLASPIVTKATLISFWAGIGLAAYLICWIVYNLYIEARNEVTIKTQYTNRGDWHSHLQIILFKCIGGTMLIIAVVLLKPGLALWNTLIQSALTAPDLSTSSLAIVAIFGLAAQLYAVFTLGVATFTTWYQS